MAFLSRWYETPGWRWMLLPTVLVLGWLGLRLALGSLPFDLPFGLGMLLRRIVWSVVYLGAAGQVLVLGALVGFFGLVGWLEVRRLLSMVWPLLPGLAFALGVGLVMGLRLLEVQDGTVGDLYQLFVRDLGPPGTAGILVAALLLGAAYSARRGSITACEKCGAWWGDQLSSTPIASQEKGGGHFDSRGGGWTRTSTVTTTYLCKFRCRKCGHEWSGQYSSRTRSEKTGLLGGWHRP